MERKCHTLLGLSVVALVAVAVLAPASRVEAGDAGDGKAVFLDNKCDMCHSVPSAGIEAKVKSEKMKGPDMTGQASRLEAGQLAKYLRKQEQVDGKDHKKEFKGSDEDLQALVAWLQGLKAE